MSEPIWRRVRSAEKDGPPSLPGIGGQAFGSAVLERARALLAAHPQLRYLMVDGGIDGTTAPLAAAAGANVLVSGSYIFRASTQAAMGERLRELEAALETGV